MEKIDKLESPLRRSRTDDQPGFEEVVETSGKYVEADGSDVRVKRVRVKDFSGSTENTYLEDEMGVRFVDNLGYEDRVE